MQNKNIDTKLHILAHEYSKKTITRKKAVDLFGTEGQKRHIEKNNSFKNKDVQKAFEKTLHQLFESVDVVRNGKRQDYKLGATRENIAPREDGRIFNRTAELEHTKYFDVIAVLRLLREPQGFIKSVSKWVDELNLVNRQFSNYKTNTEENRSFLKEILSSEKNLRGDLQSLSSDIKFLIDDITRIRSRLTTVLEQLDKDNIITLTRRNRATLNHEIEYFNKYEQTIKSNIITLDKNLHEKISAKQSKLLSDLGITIADVYNAKFINHRNAIRKKIISYHSQLREFYEQGLVFTDHRGVKHIVYIDYAWEGYEINFEWCTDNQENYLARRRPEFLKDYLEQGDDMINELVDKYNEARKGYILDKARKHVENIKSSISGSNHLTHYERHVLDNFMHNIEILYPYYMMEKDEEDDDEDDFLESEHDLSYMSEFDEIPF